MKTRGTFLRISGLPDNPDSERGNYKNVHCYVGSMSNLEDKNVDRSSNHWNLNLCFSYWHLAAQLNSTN